MSRTRTVILHMTDLHFGCDGENMNSLNSRQLALDGLVRAITRLDPDWRPQLSLLRAIWRGAASRPTTISSALGSERCSKQLE